MTLQPSAPRSLGITLALLGLGAAADLHDANAVAAGPAERPALSRVAPLLPEFLARDPVVVPLHTKHTQIAPVYGAAAGTVAHNSKVPAPTEHAFWRRVYVTDESIILQPSRYKEELAMAADRNQVLGADLYRRWASMWNGNLAIANDIIADGFVAHLTGDAPPPLEDIRDPASVARWVAAIRKRGSNLSYTVELGPIVDADLVVAYWHLVGMRQGPDGGPQQRFEKVGIDILRFRGDRLVECWTMNNNARK
jgi:hypothetical protein